MSSHGFGWDVDEDDLEAKNAVPLFPQAQKIPKDVLSAAAAVNFQENGSVQSFKNIYGATLSIRETKSVDGNVLHELTELGDPDAMSEEDKKKWPRGQVQSFVQFILGEQDYKHLFGTVKKVGGYMPLHNALFKQNHFFVGIVLEKMGADENLKDILESNLRHTTAENDTCLHLAITRNSIHTELLIDLCERLHREKPEQTAAQDTEAPNPSVFGQVDNHGNTSLHYAISLQETDEYKLTLHEEHEKAREPAASRPGVQHEPATPPHSPITEPLRRTPTASTGTEGINAQIAVMAPPIDKRQVALVERLMKADWTPLKSATRSPTGSGGRNPNTEDRLTPFQAREYAIRLRVKQQGKALFTGGGAFSQLQGAEEKRNVNKLVGEMLAREFEKLRGNDPILSVIRNFCLDKFPRSRSTTMHCLYPSGRERHIDFSLSGLRRQSIPMAYLEKLALHLQFESVLACVTLPRLRVELSAGGGDESPSGDGAKPRVSGLPTSIPGSKSQKKGKGLNDLVAIFDWLRQKQVQKIKKVVVIDDGEPCHSDEAIEDALRGLDVEVWDWKRLDVCSEVIYNCAPNVREVSLYWSGSQATLLGWYSDQGFADEKFKNLKKIILYYRKGLESQARLETYLQTFQNRIERVKQENTGLPKIRVEKQEDPEGKSFLSGFKSAGSDLMDNAWFSDMEAVLACVRRMEPPRKQLSIAIIDDGIDASLGIFDDKIAWGASFCSQLGLEDSVAPYFVSSGHHGTLMGALILRLCPGAKLYIAKLDERYSSNGGRHITAKSAAEAISWAIDAKVDIISMSWTIETVNSRDLQNLEAAVRRAQKKNILMFCAASDQGNSTTMQCYPGHWNLCLRIGAATGTGERCAWVHPRNFEHLLPGEKITYDLGDPSSPSEHSGSSVSTAIAAGLAGLIKYLHRIHEPRAESDAFYKKEDITRAFHYLGHPFPHPDKLRFLAGKDWRNGRHRKEIETGLKELFQSIKNHNPKL
ncbi:hypothetical protein QBC46DRAFT_385990 [Diplogelasinospora grovesii]|uniref:Peptidase S8/S53 domain-containing protein n=1 Tax=Diplogelasinospora grovesii TaxID=303347 RepID=A0AAN6S4E2_9PEZI|nr:hypothetical protein QBC46DRAFT_385990 [Diplogelasinospora grovesii]